MATEFAGPIGIKHVRQPEGSELCFAAIVSAVANERPQAIEKVHKTLHDHRISEADGTTSSLSEDQHVDLDANTRLALEPFIDINASRFMSAINERLQERKAVALLYKKNDDELDESLHWSLIAGRYHNDGETQGFVLMDPLQDKSTHVATSEVTDMVERTIDFFSGVWACALSVEQHA